jgi:hypothetical protein
LIILELVPPVLHQGLRELRATFHRPQDIVIYIPRHVVENIGTDLAESVFWIAGRSVARRAHEHQTKSRVKDELVLRIIFRINESLLDENSTKTVTDKYERPLWMLRDKIF